MAAPLGHILQGNINHSAGAQDLMIQTLAEWDANLAIIAEPYRVLESPDWVSDIDNSVAILRGREYSSALCTILRGRGFIIAKWGRFCVVEIYAPPSWPLEIFERTLDQINNGLHNPLTREILICRDFNAKSSLWGANREDARGCLLMESAAGLDLRLINRGNTLTCSR